MWQQIKKWLSDKPWRSVLIIGGALIAIIGYVASILTRRNREENLEKIIETQKEANTIKQNADVEIEEVKKQEKEEIKKVDAVMEIADERKRLQTLADIANGNSDE